MKIVFFFPFINEKFGLPMKWLPMSASTLISNVKKYFPKVSFYQIDLEEEIKHAVSKNKLDKHYLELLNQFTQADYNFVVDKDLKKFKFFLADIVDYFKLDQYDHYLFAVYNRGLTGINANILLAKYLKKIFKKKKIIFGGIYGYGDNYTKTSFREFNFIDSFVIGVGEPALKEILINLLNGRKIKNFYSNIYSKRNTLQQLPDFKSFRSFKYFCYSLKDLELVYQGTKLHKLQNEIKTDEKIVFIPYFFFNRMFLG